MNGNIILGIHQPNFMPWLGIFNRLSTVDHFVFFDHVQAPRGKGWISRNKILLDGKPRWLTIPIVKGKGGKQRLSDVRINYSSNFARKHLGILKQAYGKCKYFEEIYFIIERLYEKQYEFLADFNKEFITVVSNNIGFDVIFTTSSRLLKENNYLDNLAGNDLVLGICLIMNATTYVSGEGCSGFIEPLKFLEKNIVFNFQKFVHPEYRQIKNVNFVSHLSSIDALFNVGFGGFGRLVK